MGPKGMIAFEHDPEGQRLLCWAVVHKVRKEVPQIGLTREEILTALERAAAAGEQWFRGHYLEAVLGYAKTLRPPPSATVRGGEFEVTLGLTPDKRYHDLWNNPPGGSQPLLSFVHPSGTEEGSKVFLFWDGPPPPADHLQMVEDRAAIEFGDDMELGDYLARVKVCNAATGNCVMAVSPFRLVPGS